MTMVMMIVAVVILYYWTTIPIAIGVGCPLGEQLFS